MKVWTVIYKQIGQPGNKQLFQDESEAISYYKYLKSLGPEYQLEFVEIVKSNMAKGLYIKRKLDDTAKKYSFDVNLTTSANVNASREQSSQKIVQPKD